MIEKIRDIYRRRHEIQANFYFNGFKQVMLDECGSVSVSKIGQEAIGILILVVIFAIVPMLGSIVSLNLNVPPTIQRYNVSNAQMETVANPWSSVPNGTAMWAQVAPILQAAIIIIIIGLILKVIYDLRSGTSD